MMIELTFLAELSIFEMEAKMEIKDNDMSQSCLLIWTKTISEIPTHYTECNWFGDSDNRGRMKARLCSRLLRFWVQELH